MALKSLTQADYLKARASRLLSDHRARARKVGLVLDYSLTDIRQLLADNLRCEYCLCLLSFSVSLDHRIPISRGGSHSLWNLAVCCIRCNLLKGSLTGVEFKEFFSLLEGWNPVAKSDVERRMIAGGKRYAKPRK